MVEQPIRNRQVASSTLALGSNIPLEDKDLADSLNCLCPIRCKVVTNSEVFAQRIHRAHLRFIHARAEHRLPVAPWRKRASDKGLTFVGTNPTGRLITSGLS